MSETHVFSGTWPGSGVGRVPDVGTGLDRAQGARGLEGPMVEERSFTRLGEVPGRCERVF